MTRRNDFDPAAMPFAGLAPGAAPAVSFEFFPPKSAAAEARLWQAVDRLRPLGPRFVSVTYGAGGSTRAGTLKLVRRILAETEIRPAAHLTCVGASRAEVDHVAETYWQAGIRHIVALRGDAPTDGEGFRPHAQGYGGAAELVAGLKAVAPFELSVGAYPEVHPEAASAAADLDNLKRKLDAGADRAITQFFFDPAVFLRFRDRARAAGVTAPLVPGVLPIGNFKQVARFSAACGATIPRWLELLFDGLDDTPDTRQLVATVAAAEMCRELHAGGVDAFHFYTLNKPDLTYAVCHILGLRPRSPATAH